MLIRDALKRDLSRRIEEIIKVDQTDEAVVHEELSDYVVTPGRSYRETLLSGLTPSSTQTLLRRARRRWP